MSAALKNFLTAGCLGVLAWLSILFIAFAGFTLFVLLAIGLVLVGLYYWWDQYTKPELTEEKPFDDFRN